MITPWDPKRTWFTKVCANFELHSIVKGSFVCPNGQRVFSRPTGHGSSREEPGSSPYDVAIWFSKPVESEDLPNFYNLPFLGSTFEERAKSSTRLMAFRCRLNGVNVTALVDNGAEVNLISKKLSDYLDLQTASTTTNLSWFDGSTSPSNSMINTLSFTLNGVTSAATDLVVAPMSTFDLILGAPWLDDNQVVLDYSISPRQLILHANSSRSQRIVPCDHVPRGITNTTPAQLLGFISYTKAVKVLKNSNLPLLLYWFKPDVQSQPPDPGIHSTTTTPAPQLPTPDQLAKMLSPDIPAHLSKQYLSLLHEYAHVFTEPTDPILGVEDMSIRLKADVEPFSTVPYRMSQTELTELRKILQDWANRGWIKVSKDGSWASP